MVRLTAPLFSLKAQKQLGKALIYKDKKGRAILTKYSKPGSRRAFTRSDEQAQMRIIYAAGVTAWQALSDNAKDAYRQTAKYERFSGYNIFMKEWFVTYTLEMYFSFHGQRAYGLYVYAKQ